MKQRINPFTGNIDLLGEPSGKEYLAGTWQNFFGNIGGTVNNAFNTNIQGGVFEIEKETTVSKVRVRVQTANPTHTAILGIYKWNGASWDLVVQAPGTIDLGLAVVQEITYTTPVVLAPGIYLSAIQMSSTSTLEGVGVAAQHTVFGFQSTMGATSYRNNVSQATTYTGTLLANLTGAVQAVSTIPQIIYLIA